MAGGNKGGFKLQILHASDQEAGVPALQDAIGLSAVMNKLDGRYENSLKLTSGDLFIAGPFFDASRDLYDRPDGKGGTDIDFCRFPHCRGLYPQTVLFHRSVFSNRGHEAQPLRAWRSHFRLMCARGALGANSA